MARNFLGLKLALLANRARQLRHDPSRQRTLVITAVIVAWFAYRFGPDFYDNLAMTGELPDPDEFLAMQSFSLVFMWVALPLTFAGHRDLDLQRFQLLPLRPNRLVTGLAATWILSPWLYATAAATVVIVASFPVGAGRIALMAVAAVSLVVLCAVAGQLTVSGAGLLARQRRARDLLIILSVVVSAVPVLLVFEMMQQFEDPAANSSIADAVGWLPLSWPGQAIAAAGAGDTGVALAWLAGTLVLIAGCGWAWSAIVERSLLAEDASTTRRERNRDPFGSFARRLPHNRRGAVAALELRLMWREPGRLPNALLFTALLGGIVTAMAAVSYGTDDPHLAAVGAIAITFTVIGRRTNEIGMHASALWTNVVVPGRAADDLVGRDLAAACIDVPLITALAVGITAGTGGWALLAPTLLAGAAAVLATYGAIRVVSVRMAQGQPQGKDAQVATGGGQDPIASLFAVAVYLVAMAPVFAVMAVPAVKGAGWMALAVPVALAYGAGIWWATLRWLGGWLDQNEADLLNQLTR